MQTQITDLEKFALNVAAENAAGASVPITDVPVWTSDNTAAATVLASPDGLSAEVTSVAAGTANITVTSMGLSVSDTVTVVVSPATTLVLTAGAPVNK